MTEPVVLPAGLGGNEIWLQVRALGSAGPAPYQRVHLHLRDGAGHSTPGSWLTADQARDLAWQLLDHADAADVLCGNAVAEDEEPDPALLESVVLPA